jgi:hypothetical protein
MTPLAILEIIRLILEIWSKTLDGIPVDSRQQMWKDNEKVFRFWTNLFEKMFDAEKRSLAKESQRGDGQATEPDGATDAGAADSSSHRPVHRPRRQR